MGDALSGEYGIIKNREREPWLEEGKSRRGDPE